MIADLGIRRRREGVITTLASFEGSACWPAINSRGHNLATVRHCISKGLVTQRSPTGTRVFDLTPRGWALANILKEADQLAEIHPQWSFDDGHEHPPCHKPPLQREAPGAGPEAEPIGEGER